MLSVKLLESDRQIQSKIYQALAKELNKSFRDSASKMKLPIVERISYALYSSPAIVALQAGPLRFDFGLTESPANDIVHAIVQSIEVSSTPIRATANTIKGTIFIKVQPTDYNNLLSLSVATQSTAKGVNLPWLDWLLTRGDEIIVANFGVEYGPFGRSGGAHMVDKERPFKVNTLYSGTADDNFITRALGRIAPQIKNVIRSSV